LIGLAIGKQTPTQLQGVDLDKRLLWQIEQFFVSYNKLDGKKFRVLGTHGPKKAKDLVRKAFKAYEKKVK
jgi:inorganic pyrophosphatase